MIVYSLFCRRSVLGILFDADVMPAGIECCNGSGSGTGTVVHDKVSGIGVGSDKIRLTQDDIGNRRTDTEAGKKREKWFDDHLRSPAYPR